AVPLAVAAADGDADVVVVAEHGVVRLRDARRDLVELVDRRQAQAVRAGPVLVARLPPDAHAGDHRARAVVAGLALRAGDAARLAVVHVEVEVRLAAVGHVVVAVGVAGEARDPSTLVVDAGGLRVGDVAHRAGAASVGAHEALGAHVAARAAVLRVGGDGDLA